MPSDKYQVTKSDRQNLIQLLLMLFSVLFSLAEHAFDAGTGAAFVEFLCHPVVLCGQRGLSRVRVCTWGCRGWGGITQWTLVLWTVDTVPTATRANVRGTIG